MRIIRQGDVVVVVLTTDETNVIISCAGETLEALEDWEFQTRVGVSREAVEVLRDGLNQALET
jgi:hypothetical protein